MVSLRISPKLNLPAVSDVLLVQVPPDFFRAYSEGGLYQVAIGQGKNALTSTTPLYSSDRYAASDSLSCQVFSESLVRVENVKAFNLVADFGKQRLEKFQVAKLDNL